MEDSWGAKLMMESIARTVRDDNYQRGFRDGYSEGLSKAMEHYKDVIALSTRPLIITVSNKEELERIKKEFTKE